MIPPIFVAIAVTMIGYFSRVIYEKYRDNYKFMYITNIFGSNKMLLENSVAVLPVFESLSKDEFSEGEHSHLRKRRIKMHDASEVYLSDVPMYSDVFVYDDYAALKKINDELSHHKYPTLSFIDDISSLQVWDRDLLLCIGGPRSNQKTKQVMLKFVTDYMEIYDDGECLSDWTMKIKESNVTYASTTVTAYSYIIKISHPDRPKNKIIILAGDSSRSTLMSAIFISKNAKDISGLYGIGDFIIALEADRSSLDSARILYKRSVGL